MPDRDLRTLTDAGVFADIDRYFGESMIDLGATPEIALSAAMVSAMYRAGHTCLPLAHAGKAIVDILPPPTRADEMPEPAANVSLARLRPPRRRRALPLPARHANRRTGPRRALRPPGAGMRRGHQPLLVGG